MICFSISLESSNKVSALLSHIIMIDIFYPEYTILISCSKDAQDYIRKFPYKFSGLIEFVCDMEENENSFTFFKRKMNNMKTCIRRWGSALEMPTGTFTFRQFTLPDNVGDVCFPETGVGAAPDKPYEKYNINILYISSILCVEFIEKIFNEAEQEIMNEIGVSNKDVESGNNNKIYNEGAIDTWRKINTLLIEEFSIKTFFPYNMCFAPAFTMAYDKSLSFDNIDRSLSYIVSDDTDKSTNESDKVNKIIRKDPIYFALIDLTSSDDISGKLQTTLLNKMIAYSAKYISLIQLTAPTEGLEIAIPAKHGCYRWNRSNNPPGLYDVADLIVENYSDYVKILTDNRREYFSFNNLLLFDKPDDSWLTNMTATYFEIFICNYGDELLKVLESSRQPSSFLCYHSDEPRKLKENRDAYIQCKKVYDVVSVEEGNIKAFKYLAKTNKLKEKATFDTNDLSWEEKYKIISKSKFIMINEIDVNLIANCLAMQVVIIADENITLLDIEKDKHYIHFGSLQEKFPMWKDLAADCEEYYSNSISPKGVFTKLLAHVFQKEY